MTLAAIYTRCSTEEQADRNLSLPAQEAACRRWAEEHGLAVVAVFADAGVSGGSEDRDGIHALLAGAAEGAFGRVLLWDSSRLARDTELALRWERILRAAGCEPTYVTQPFLDGSPAGTMVRTFVAAADQHLREIGRENTRRGIRHTVTVNHHWSGGQAPYGFRLAEKRLEVDEPEAVVIREILRWRIEEGLGLVRIAKRLNERHTPTPSGRGRWSQSGLHQILTNRALTGLLCYDTYPRGPGGPRERVEVSGGCPAILSPEEFASLGLSRNGAKWRVPGEGVAAGPIPAKRRRTHVLAGLLRCCECGAPMRWQGGGRGGRPDYYVCRRWAGPSGDCHGPFLRAELVEPLVVEAVLSEVLSDAGMAAIAKRIADEAATREGRAKRSRAGRQSRLGRVEAEIGRLASAIAAGGALEGLLAALSERESERDALREELSLREPERAPGPPQGPSADEWLAATRAALREAPAPRQNAILAQLIESVTHDPRTGALHLSAWWPVTYPTSTTPTASRRRVGVEVTAR